MPRPGVALTEKQYDSIRSIIRATEVLGMYNAVRIGELLNRSQETIRAVRRADTWERYCANKAANRSRAKARGQEPGAGASVERQDTEAAAGGTKALGQAALAGTPLVGVAPTPPRPEAKRPFLLSLIRRKR